MQAGKWQDKKELLDKLVAATDVPLIAPADFSCITSQLAVRLGDAAKNFAVSYVSS